MSDNITPLRRDLPPTSLASVARIAEQNRRATVTAAAMMVDDTRARILQIAPEKLTREKMTEVLAVLARSIRRLAMCLIVLAAAVPAPAEARYPECCAAKGKATRCLPCRPRCCAEDDDRYRRCSDCRHVRLAR